MSAQGDSSSSATIPQHSLLPNPRPTLELDGRVAVWRLPSEISQSRLGGRPVPSNACTLIALQLIELIERRDLHFTAPTQPPTTPLQPHRAVAGAETPHTVSTRYLLGTFVEAMVDGNEAHERALRTRHASALNFTIPDAITALRFGHTEIDFCTVTGSLLQQLPRFIRIALNSPSLLPLDRLHFLVIAFERTVLLVADRRTDTLVLFDSHLHGSVYAPTTGAVIAAAHFSELTTLAQWMTDWIFPETNSHFHVQEFEISTLSYSGSRDCLPQRVGSFSTRRVPPVPVMRPMPIFTTPTDKGNRSICSSSSSPSVLQQPQQAPKKLGKRGADSLEPAAFDSSNNRKRTCLGLDATS